MCLVTRLFYPTYSGAANRFRRYAPGFKERGIDYWVYSQGVEGADGSPGSDPRFPPLAEVDGLPVQRVLTSGGVRGDWSFFSGLAELSKRPDGSADVYQFLSLPIWSIPTLIGLRRRRKPMVFTHTLLSPLRTGGMRRRLQRVYRRTPLQFMDRIVVSTRVMREELEEIGVTIPVVVIPNGVDLKAFTPPASVDESLGIRKELRIDAGAEVVLFAGPINSRKGIDILLEAWSRIVRGRPNLWLMLVGPIVGEAGAGTEFRRRLESIAESSGASRRVRFVGQVNDVRPYYRSADVFVLPSAREGMPNVVPESYACGLPTIMTPYLGLSDDFGRPDQEYVLAERTPESLAASIAAVLDSRGLRSSLARAGRRWAQEHMDIEASLDQYVELYRMLAERNRTRERDDSRMPA